MQKTLIGGIAVAALTAAGAHAGDLPMGPCGGRPCPPIYPPLPPPPPAPPPYLYWCGPYLGANLGFQSGVLSNSTARPSGFAGGIQGGYSWQFGQWVAGWEADFQFSNANDTFSIHQFSNPWFGTIRGRSGLAFDNLLIYGTLGLAYGHGEINVGSLSEVNTHVGWAAGAGVEYGFSPNWSIKAEYLRVDLSSEPYILTGLNHSLSSNVFRIGVNFHF